MACNWLMMRSWHCPNLVGIRSNAIFWRFFSCMGTELSPLFLALEVKIVLSVQQQQQQYLFVARNYTV